MAEPIAATPTVVSAEGEPTPTPTPSAVPDVTAIDNNTGETTTTSFLDGKYNSVSDMENGYKELQSSYSKKLGGFDGAPEAYTRYESIPEGDALHAYASEWGKDNQMSDKGLNEFVEGYNAKQTEQLQAYQAEQLKQLGPDAKDRLQNVSDYMKANTGIDDVALQQINDGLFGAKGVEVLEALISSTKQSTPTAAPVVRTMDKQELVARRMAKNERGERLMSVDPEYRKKQEAMELEEFNSRR
jgi:hypothetical protein